MYFLFVCYFTTPKCEYFQVRWKLQLLFPFLPVTFPCTPFLSQRVIDHIPFLNPTDRLSL